jgi:hypothetical protein
MQHDARRLRRLAHIAALLPFAADPALISAPVAADQVIEAGFYRQAANQGCAGAIVDGSRVPLGELARNAEGHRIIYFCTVVDVEHARYLILSLGRGAATGDGSGAQARVQSRARLPDPILQAARAFRVGNLADVLNLVVEIGDGVSRHRAVGFRYVSSYGPLLGTVVDPDGKEFPGVSPRRVEIVP